ncbi:MAG: pseudouridine synthase [Candidatus Latescibacteria bacterium]|nr:pseudouridine synthase [Candidatus Latescibacterota bacterium]
MQFDILYRDEDVVAIQKPSGWFVHQTDLDRSASSCMPVLRDQLGQWVYPVHRLDRGTSGALLFALSSEMARELGAGFASRQVSKTYLALVRGYLPKEGQVDFAYCPPDSDDPVEAVTDFQCLGTVELPHAVGRYDTARYSLMRAMPITGRQHQIRRHCAHLRHPIVGDVRYGDRHHNQFFQTHFNIHRLLLMATRLSFEHPSTGEHVEIQAPVPSAIQRLFQQFGWGNAIGDNASHYPSSNGN